MSVQEIFARRPTGASLVALGIVLLGAITYHKLPIALLPAVDLPTISVFASLPGASPKTVAATVAAPLERELGRIAGVTDLSSFSLFGSTSITVQFELGRDIDGAANDVQAAINAAAKELPKDLPNPVTFQKSNPATVPLLMLALTSDTLPPETVSDYAETVVAQKLAQLEGIAGVSVDGAEKSAIRVRINPAALSSLGLGLDDVRTAIAETTASNPKGGLDGPSRAAVIAANEQLYGAAAYRSLVIAESGGALVHLADIATVFDGTANTRLGGWFNDRRAVFVVVMRQPGANLVETVDRIRALLPQFEQWIPPGIKITVLSDRSDAIRAGVAHIQLTLGATVALVALVILLFLRRISATLIPSSMIPVSLAGTLGVMYLLDYSLDILSLMALTIAVGFVVDDAIVMVESVVRYRDAGYSPLQATLLGARQISATIIAMTASLIAALIPLLFLPGVVGRFMQEIGITLGTAIVISATLSLTLAPALCARFLFESRAPGSSHRKAKGFLAPPLKWYEASLRWVIRHQSFFLVVTLLTCGATTALYVFIPKGFVPPQDTGVISGSTEGAQGISTSERKRHTRAVAHMILSDPAVMGVASSVTSWGNWLSVNLKSIDERKATSLEVITRLQSKLAQIPGVTTHLYPVQDFWLGGRQGYAQYQYTLQSEDADELNRWVPIVRDKLQHLSELKDVSTYKENRGLEVRLQIDRDRAAQLGVSPELIDETLYNAFGQRQIATFYGPVDQFPIVLELDAGRQDLDVLDRVHIKSTDGDQVPLSVVTRTDLGLAPMSVARQGQLPYATLTFNLRAGVSLSQAMERIRVAEVELRLPASLHGSFAGNAKAFQSSSESHPLLILTAILAVYIVLGVLYESCVHPLTILSTLPSAGLGALLALLACGLDLSIVAFVGIILLIGIVTKNAIMMIDSALLAERWDGLAAREAILAACLLRFRPIVMTTMTAALGSLPLAFAMGPGSELRQPLGVAVAGGLLLSQLLTLYTTPVIYLYFDRLRLRWRGAFSKR